MPLTCPWPHPYGFPSGARQYLWIQAINKVTLADGAYIVLDLQPEEFIATPENPLGYDRISVPDHEALMTYGASGVPVVDGAWFDNKYQFTWNLNLDQARATTLKAIYDTQQIRLKTLRTNYAVKLLDTRLMLQECAPRTRAAVTGLEASYPVAPQGQIYSYAIFDVLLKKPQDADELLGHSFQQKQTGTIEALELDLVTVDGDLAFNSPRPDNSGPLWDNTDW